MNSLALFMVDLQMAQGRLRRVFDMLDEMSTAWTPNSKMVNAREAELARGETLGRSSINGFDFTESDEVHSGARVNRRRRYDESSRGP
ncbi:MAG TPA: hypothetical protein VN857_00835 [Chthoniobacterales bacterium]|jgi:hypothetical protein|nr:hypothetical protein [Chthoniobacterales bacterium]